MCQGENADHLHYKNCFLHYQVHENAAGCFTVKKKHYLNAEMIICHSPSGNCLDSDPTSNSFRFLMDSYILFPTSGNRVPLQIKFESGKKKKKKSSQIVLVDLLPSFHL